MLTTEERLLALLIPAIALLSVAHAMGWLERMFSAVESALEIAT